MKRITSTIILVFFIGSLCGCASYMTARLSQDEIYKEKIYASGDQVMINAVENGTTPRSAIKAFTTETGVGVGVNILSWKVLSKKPVKQVLSALFDAVLIYGASEGIEAIRSEINNEDNRQDNSNEININVTGDNNNINTN